jgi:hypothetical protein
MIEDSRVGMKAWCNSSLIPTKITMRTGKKYWERKPGFGLEGKAKMSKTVKTP